MSSPKSNPLQLYGFVFLEDLSFVVECQTLRHSTLSTIVGQAHGPSSLIKGATVRPFIVLMIYIESICWSARRTRCRKTNSPPSCTTPSCAGWGQTRLAPPPPSSSHRTPGRSGWEGRRRPELWTWWKSLKEKITNGEQKKCASSIFHRCIHISSSKKVLNFQIVRRSHADVKGTFTVYVWDKYTFLVHFFERTNTQAKRFRGLKLERNQSLFCL